MQGNAEVIDVLNEVLTAELTAINQYFVHAKMCSNWGYNRLAHHIRDESIDEMRHAEELIDRVLYLDGVPNLQRLYALRVGEDVVEQFNNDLAVEREAVDRLRRGIALCNEVADHGTRQLFEKILVAEEEHIDWLETQLTTIEQIGVQNYLSEQLGEHPSH
ncbi:MAG: bacterioferritin [Microthrixaceae bacterium]|nr:bacterioferritin [Microthrixaceae bacterium]